MGTNFIENIFITRDPRAELISRIHYVAFPFFQSKHRPSGQAEEWIALFRRKEQDSCYTLLNLIEDLRSKFGVRITESSGQMSDTYARFVRNVPDRLKCIIRYEDFVTSNFDDHPLSHLFSGSRDVGETLQRTNRSGGFDDWKAFVSEEDVAWMNEKLEFAMNSFGYEPHVELFGEIKPENCSEYVARIISEAQATYQK